MNRTRNLALTLSLVAALGASACGQEAQEEGQEQTEISYVAETEGIYLTIEDLKYQVQVSRQLNPLLSDDATYLDGVSAEDRQLEDDEVWFAIFMRVQNYDDVDHERVEDFEIRDTQENVYRPVTIGPGNDFAYRPGITRSDEEYPLANSPAGERQPQGAVILFKIKRFSLDNRPLELILEGRESNEEGLVNLDV